MHEDVSLQPCQFFSPTGLALEGSLTHGRCSAKPIRPSANNLPSLPGRSFKMKRRSCGESEELIRCVEHRWSDFDSWSDIGKTGIANLLSFQKKTTYSWGFCMNHGYLEDGIPGSGE